MPSPQLKPGSEIDGWCTQCKADKVHRVIALIGSTPQKVECLSCKGHHKYRPTQAQKEAKAAHKRASRGDKPPTARQTALSQLKRREDDAHATWEKAVTGKEYAAFKPYKIDGVFAKGDLLRHTKFGDGLVTTILDAHKFEVLFGDGPRTLAQSTRLP